MPLRRARQSGPHCLPGGEDHLGVALGAEAVALAPRALAHLAEIVDLAVEHHHLAAAVGEHRLRGGVGEVDDREAAVAEADARRGPDAAAVGAAMGDARRSSPRPAPDRPAWDVGMEDAGDAAHGASPGRRRGRRAVDRAERARGRRRSPGARLRSRDQDRDRALRAAEQAHLHRFQLHPHCAPRQDVADTVEAHHFAFHPVRGDPFRASVRRRRGVGGPGPGASGLRSRPGRSRPARAPRSAGRRRRWRASTVAAPRVAIMSLAKRSAPAKWGRHGRPGRAGTARQPGNLGHRDLGGNDARAGGRNGARPEHGQGGKREQRPRR